MIPMQCLHTGQRELILFLALGASLMGLAAVTQVRHVALRHWPHETHDVLDLGAWHLQMLS